ncbi:RNA polymerase sigma-70 factor, ECF subfamily, partial [Streptomyces sp. Ncost-T6T-2b]
KGAEWGIAHPTFGLPTRRRRPAPASDRAAVRVAA